LYLDIITRKTASLIGVSALLGARYAGADEATAAALQAFGESLGIAFQIIDDLLDSTGDERQVGKSLGRDVQKGKLTLGVIHYLRTQPPAARETMLGWLRGDDPQRHRHVAALLAASDSLDYANQTAYTYIRRGLE